MRTGVNSNVERVVAGAWADALELDEGALAPDANFFALGGDSLAAMQIAASIASSWPDVPEVELKVLVGIFERPTVAGLAELLEEAHATAG